MTEQNVHDDWHTTYDDRLKSVKEAQNRSRTALVVSVVTSLAVLFSTWNAALSWRRQIAFQKLPDPGTVQEHLVKQLLAD